MVTTIRGQDIADYWAFVRLYGSESREERIRAEHEPFLGWYAITETVEDLEPEATEVIVSVAQAAVTAEDVAYVVTDLVESYTAGGGNVTALLIAARKSCPALYEALRCD